MMLTVVLAAPVAGAAFVAVGESTNWDPSTLIGTAAAPGVLVVLIIMFFAGKLHGPKEFDALVAERDRYRDENANLHSLFHDSAVPAITRANDAVQTVTATVRDELRMVRDELRYLRDSRRGD